MSENSLQQLQQSANLALKREEILFSLLREDAARLKTAYTKLQESFQTVNQELGADVKPRHQETHYLVGILTNISDAVLVIDLNGTILVYNEAAQKLLKMKPENVLFKRYSDLFSDDYFGFSMREALTFGIPHKLLYKSYPADRKELEVSTSFVYEGAKQDHGMILVLRDISEKKRLQLALNQGDRMKELGEMAATVAHEIRNPLGAIRGYASLLYRDLEESPHLQEMAGSILEGTKSLERIVNAILQSARPVQVQFQTLDLCAYLRQMGKFLKMDPAFPENVKLSLNVPNAPLLVPIDPEAMKSALLNLAFNAFQAMPRGGILSLSLFQREASCQIDVSDTGIGMDEELMKSLFSLFFTTKSKGNGIGLVETQKIIQAHFGSIDVRSTPGKGSTFTLTLPLKR